MTKRTLWVFFTSSFEFSGELQTKVLPRCEALCYSSCLEEGGKRSGKTKDGSRESHGYIIITTFIALPLLVSPNDSIQSPPPRSVLQMHALPRDPIHPISSHYARCGIA